MSGFRHRRSFGGSHPQISPPDFSHWKNHDAFEAAFAQPQLCRRRREESHSKREIRVSSPRLLQNKTDRGCVAGSAATRESSENFRTDRRAAAGPALRDTAALRPRPDRDNRKLASHKVAGHRPHQTLRPDGTPELPHLPPCRWHKFILSATTSHFVAG